MKSHLALLIAVSTALSLSPSFPALAADTFQLVALDFEKNKPDPLKLSLDELLSYAEFLREKAGYMSANSVLIMVSMNPGSHLSAADLSRIKNQIVIYYRKLAEEEAQSEHAQLARPYFDKAESLQQQGEFEAAAKVLHEIKELLEARQAKQQSIGNELSTSYFKLAELALMKVELEKASELAQQAISAMTHNNNMAVSAQAMLNMGRIQLLSEQSGLTYAEMAQNMASMGMATEQMVGALLLKGQSYQSLGKAEQALSYFLEASKLAEEIKSPAALDILILMAQAQVSLNQLKAAKASLTKAEKSLNLQTGVFTRHSNQLRLAQAYAQLGEDALAEPYFKAAQAGFKQLPTAYYEAQAVFGQAEIQRKAAQLAEARALYQQALELAAQVPRNRYLGEYRSALGQTLLALEQPSEAITVLEEALSELMGSKLSGRESLREASERLVPTYQALIEAHLRVKDGSKDDFVRYEHLNTAFRYLENSKSAVFLEDLHASNNTMVLGGAVYENFLAENDVRKYLPAGTAALSFSQSRDKNLISFAFEASGFETDILDFRAELARHPLYLKYADKLKLKVNNQPDLARLCQAYRQLLSNPQSDLSQLHDLGWLLYQLLIKPHQAFIGQSKRLLVIPDGALALIPFETLIDEQGRYLAQSLDIQYVQSFDVLYHLSNSLRNYQQERKPMLAIGNADYQPVSYQSTPVETPAEVLNLMRQIWAEPQRSMREIYGALYAPAWQSLPGSLNEIQAIEQLVPGTELLQGAEVDEARIKSMAQSQQLAQYQVLHWAVHGLTVPEIPELSAVVLSQTSAEQAEDNYLRMPEIKELGLKADFVNLSACETGLGKLFRGEGVVGLTQAFLLAGANRVSVSLWQISDAGTSKFMPAFYGQLDKGYAQALNQVKREFIAGKFGEDYRHPYYWSPFVLYGRF